MNTYLYDDGTDETFKKTSSTELHPPKGGEEWHIRNKELN